MKINLYSILVSFLILGCNQKRIESTPEKESNSKFNITEKLVSELNWMNQPDSVMVKDSVLQITAREGSDFFNDPETHSVTGSAPYLYKEVDGNFVAKVLVQPDFSSQWNAVALMVYQDSLNWIKFAFENSDATGPSIVTVVTKGTSDDANGVVLNSKDKVWLAIARKQNVYSMHWSIDDITYKMARLTSMPDKSIVKIGIEAQSPVGSKAIHKVLYFKVEEIAPENLRNLNEKVAE